MCWESLAQAIAHDIGYDLSPSGHMREWDVDALFYSAAARLSLCSIWDGEENDGGQQTVEHFKDKLVETLYAYAASVLQFRSPLNLATSDRLREVAEEMFQTYWQTGNFYRCSSKMAHRLMAVPARSVDCERVSFLRGVLPGQNLKMSGIGCYQVGGIGNVDEACRFFGFGEPVLATLLGTVASSLEWKPLPNIDRIEYLNTMIRPGHRLYWDTSCCDRDGKLSLARYGQKGTETYVMYRMAEDGKMAMAIIPEWRCDHPWGKDVRAEYTTKEYLRLAAAAMAARGTLPNIAFSVMGQLVRVRLGYLLPTAEENFFRLYSWPNDFRNIGTPVKVGNENFDQQVCRVMTKELFGAFRKMMERQGYAFKEVKES